MTSEKWCIKYILSNISSHKLHQLKLDTYINTTNKTSKNLNYLNWEWTKIGHFSTPGICARKWLHLFEFFSTKNPLELNWLHICSWFDIFLIVSGITALYCRSITKLSINGDRSRGMLRSTCKWGQMTNGVANIKLIWVRCAFSSVCFKYYGLYTKEALLYHIVEFRIFDHVHFVVQSNIEDFRKKGLCFRRYRILDDNQFDVRFERCFLML